MSLILSHDFYSINSKKWFRDICPPTYCVLLYINKAVISIIFYIIKKLISIKC